LVLRKLLRKGQPGINSGCPFSEGDKSMADTLGQKIKKIRQAKSMSQVEFSLGLGISQGRLSEIEKDKTNFSSLYCPLVVSNFVFSRLTYFTPVKWRSHVRL
jgi:DNA-binding XRE family transcriptional regulator